MVAPVVFHRTASVIVNQVSHHKPLGEGKARGVVCRNEITETGPKMFQNITELPIETMTRDWYKQLKENRSALRNRGTECPRMSDENVEKDTYS
jgi:hypothetical protein